VPKAERASVEGHPMGIFEKARQIVALDGTTVADLPADAPEPVAVPVGVSAEMS
jgi:hypothetical protein